MYLTKQPDFPLKEVIIASQFLCPKDPMYNADAVAVFACNNSLVTLNAGLAFRQKQVKKIAIFSIGHMFDHDYLYTDNEHHRTKSHFLKHNFTEDDLVCVDNAGDIVKNNEATMTLLAEKGPINNLVIACRSIYQRRALLSTQSLIKKLGLPQPSYINRPAKEEVKSSVHFASKLLAELNIVMKPAKFGFHISCAIPQEVKEAAQGLNKYITYFYG